MATKGYGAAEVEHTYARAQALCLEVGEPQQVAKMLAGLWVFYCVRGDHTAALALGEQFLGVAERQQDATLSLVVNSVLGGTLLWRGEFANSQVHLDKVISLYVPEQHRDLGYQMGDDPGLWAMTYRAETLWFLGYPDRAREQDYQALALAQNLAHPLSLAGSLAHIAQVHLFRREGQEALAHLEALLPLTQEHGFAWWLGLGMSLRGWALVERADQREAGLLQIREGLAALKATATESELYVPLVLGALASGYAQSGQTQEGLQAVTEALALVEKNKERWTEAELFRIKGDLLVHEHSSEKAEPAAGCFHKAIEIAQRQRAKSLELRAVMSLARLWQQQEKQAEAHQLLFDIYNWFTEGFDTKDLKDAKALLDELE